MSDGEKLVALAARLRGALGRRVNPCLGPKHSVRLRTDAERINTTANAIEAILKDFGL